MICPLCQNQTNTCADDDLVQRTLKAVETAFDRMTELERSQFFAEVKHQWLARIPPIDDGPTNF